jgi:hypothetical protein
MRGTPQGKPARGVVRRASAVWYRVMADCSAAGVHGAAHGHAARAWGGRQGVWQAGWPRVSAAYTP